MSKHDYPKFPSPRSRTYNLTGIKFGKLTAKEYIMDNGTSRWLCECECGNTSTPAAHHLVAGNVVSCGCSRDRVGEDNWKWTGIHEISGKHISDIMSQAKRRDIEYDLSNEYIWDLFISQGRKCAISGADIEFSTRSGGSKTASLDRMDSSKGYVEGNVWWVHKDINIMKNVFSLDKFQEWCNMVVNHQKESNENIEC